MFAATARTVQLATRRAAVAALAGVLALLTVGLQPASAAANDNAVSWLCRPGLANNPCEIPMDTTIQYSSGGSRVYTADRPASSKRKIDCFYVYPTVSNQLTPNATKTADPEITSIARFQAARFSTQCRMFAPLYRQFPLAGIPLGGALGQLPIGPAKIAYTDVVTAWKSYLAHDNHGRGVVLIGHSQGSLMLRRLMHDYIDPTAAQRKLVVGAVLLGGNVLTAKGSTKGGDFKHIPICTKRGQAGCVVAFSTYDTNPIVPFFGSAEVDVLSYIMALPSGSRYQVACTDPGTLSGLTKPVGVTIPSKPFAPGIIATGIQLSVLGKVPTAATTGVTSKDRYVGSCRKVNLATIYRYDPTPGSMRPLEFPPTWGTHLFDMNLGLERLTSIVAQQRATWLKHH